MQSSEMEIMALEGGVLLPGAILPLNIFEPRYTKMLSEGLKGNRTFAVCHIEEGKPAQYYGLGLIKSSVRHENGTYIVTLEGVTRYRINKIVSMVPLLRVESQLAVIESKVASDTKLRKNVEKIVTSFGDKYPESKSDLEKLTDNPLDDSDFCDRVAGMLLGDYRAKQQIMETLSVEKRLTLLHDFLDTARF